MAVNPYTLNNLYAQGIIDYVPAELLMPTPVGSMQSMTNPYLNLAKQGNLYQQHGSGDSFSYTGNVPAYAEVNEIGSKSSSGILSMFGDKNIGVNNSQGVVSTFGQNGIGYDNQNNIASMYGGFGDTRQNISNGFGKAQAIYNGTPTVLKGLAAGAIGLWALVHCFKRKKAPKNSKSILAKLNPLNWFKKAPKPEPVKQSFWSKLNPLKK